MAQGVATSTGLGITANEKNREQLWQNNHVAKIEFIEIGCLRQ
jgi:hypothetical protein